MERVPSRPLVPRWRSVGTKLAGATVGVLFLATGLVFSYTSRVERERVLSAKEQTGKVVIALLAQGAQAPVAFDDTKGVEEQVALFLSVPSVVDAAVFGLDATGNASRLGQSSREPLEEGFDLSSARGLAGGVQRGKAQILVQAPILSPRGLPVGVARLVFTLADEKAAIAQTQRRALFGAIALGVGLAVVLIALTRSLIVRRLGALAHAAGKLQRGEHAEVAVRGDDEVSALASAFRAMSGAIEAREAEILRRSADMRRVLDNVDAGFLTVDLEGRMSAERSRVLERWFGRADDEDFFAYLTKLSPIAAHTMKNGWRDIADDFMPLEVILDQLPSRIDDAQGRSFSFGYTPIHGDPKDESAPPIGIVVSVNEITQAVKREAVERAQREAMAVFRRLQNDRSGFRLFVAEATRLMAAIRTGSGGRDALTRDLHTLKGNASVYELEALAATCHALEDRIADEQLDELAPEDLARLEAAWGEFFALFNDLGGGEHRLEISLDEYERLLADVRRGTAPSELEERIRALSEEPARVYLSRASHQAHAIARRVGKSIQVDLSVTPPDLRLDETTWHPIWLAVPHLLRNALDHGVEDGDSRRAAGKSTTGRLQLRLVEDDDVVRLSVTDDGRGIDWEKLRSVAERRGLPALSREDLVEALFTDEVTTRTDVSETSGRGVGTSAMRSAVRAAGGRIDVSSERGVSTTFVLEVPRLRSPHVLVEDSRAA